MHIVSNIHTVPAYISADNVNTWRFSSKVQNSTCTFNVSRLAFLETLIHYLIVS